MANWVLVQTLRVLTLVRLYLQAKALMQQSSHGSLPLAPGPMLTPSLTPVTHQMFHGRTHKRWYVYCFNVALIVIKFLYSSLLQGRTTARSNGLFCTASICPSSISTFTEFVSTRIGICSTPAGSWDQVVSNTQASSSNYLSTTPITCRVSMGSSSNYDLATPITC